MKKLLHALQFIAAQVLLAAILAISAPAIQMAQAATIYDSFNTSGVYNGPKVATVFSVSSAVKITNIMTYHYNNGSGSTPGTISLKHTDGTVYGPWTATGYADPNYFKLFWNVYPDAVIKSGTYTVIDSGTATWSYNSASGNAGFVLVQGDVVTASTYAISTAASPTAGGSVTCSPNPVSSGSNSTCTAAANSGYTFAGWSGDCTGATATCALSNVTALKSVTAVFNQVAATKYTITAVASPAAGGSVTCSPNPVSSGSGSSCIAAANSGYTFVSWSGDCSGTTSTCTLSNVTAQMSVTAVFSMATTMTTQQVSLAEIAGMLPDPSIPDGAYLAQRNFDALGVANVDLKGVQAVFVGDRLRVENIRINGASNWEDFQLSTSGGIAFVPVTSLAKGVPSQPLSGNPLAGIDTSKAEAFLFGPPLQLAVTPIGISGQYYTALFGFGNNGKFAYKGVEQTNLIKVAQAGDFAATDPINDWIAGMSKVDAVLPSDTDLGQAITDCGFTMIGNISLPPELETVAKKVIIRMVGNGQMLTQIKGAAADGDFGSASHLTVEYLTAGLIEATTSADELGILADALKISRDVYGNNCVGNYKAALKARVSGVFDAIFPIQSCGLKVMIEGVRFANDYFNDARVADLYQQWLKSSFKGDWNTFSTLPGVASMIRTLSMKYYDFTKTPDERERLATEQLRKMFQVWESTSTAGGVRAAQLSRAKSFYDQLGSSTQARLAGQAQASNSANDNAIGGFVRYDRILGNARRQLAQFRPLGVSEEQLDRDAALAASYAADGNIAGYKNTIANQIVIYKRLQANIFQAATDGIDVPAFCAAPVTPATPATESGEVAYDYKADGTANAIGIKYTISGGSSLVRTPVGNTSYASYSGKLVAGSTLTVAGSGWSVPEWKVSMTSFDKYPMWLEANVTVDGNAKDYKYYTPKGESMNTNFSLSVPIPADATNGSFKVLVCWRSAYRDQCAQVGGSLSR